MMHIFEELAIAKDAPVKYEIREGRRLGMEGYKSCLSISMKEFDFVRNFVRTNKLHSGVEIGCAIGGSALAFSLGMKDAGRGIYVSIDSFQEEFYDDGSAYFGNSYEVYKDSKGWKSVNYLVNRYGLGGVLRPNAGYSPNDVCEILMRELWKPVDVAFVDAAHETAHAIRDFDAILPFLNNRFAIFFHDTHMLGGEVWDHVYDKLGVRMIQIEELKYPSGYYMGIVSNL
jgi:predicted O-methyltransferase YrrM